MNSRMLSLLVMLPLLGLLLVACGSTSTGLINDRPLVAGSFDPGFREWTGETPEHIVATGLLLEPVLVAGGGSADAHADLSAALRQVLIERCGTAVPVTSKPSDGVVHIRTAVEGVSVGSGEFAYDGGLDLSSAALVVEIIQDGDTVTLFSWDVPAAAGVRPAGRRWGRTEAAFVGFAELIASRLVRRKPGETRWGNAD